VKRKLALFSRRRLNLLVRPCRHRQRPLLAGVAASSLDIAESRSGHCDGYHRCCIVELRSNVNQGKGNQISSGKSDILPSFVRTGNPWNSLKMKNGRFRRFGRLVGRMTDLMNRRVCLSSERFGSPLTGGRLLEGSRNAQTNSCASSVDESASIPLNTGRDLHSLARGFLAVNQR
jgi:hypothetical protein